MPAKSKSQQSLFGMVRAYQKGQLKHPPAKVKDVAKHISPTDATHFAATKRKGLPNKVKKATHVDEAEDKQLIKNMVKPNSLKKEAFELGFVKAALSRGFNPLQAVNLLKQAFDEASLMELIQKHPQLIGALGGAGIGAGGGALLGGHGHRGEGALLGGIAGAGLGGLAGTPMESISGQAQSQVSPDLGTNPSNMQRVIQGP